MGGSLGALIGSYASELGDYEPIASANGTGSSSLITFSNIPQTYQHLQLRVTARTTFANTTDTMYIYNYDGSSSSTNSAVHFLYGNSGYALANNTTGNFSSIIGYVTANNALANAYGVVITDFLDYSNVNKNKTIRSTWGWDDNGNTSQDTYIGIGSSIIICAIWN